MKLKQFQLDAIKELKISMAENYHNIILKSPTGSGKTLILTQFMGDYVKENPNVVFIWFTPGRGDLEEQSKAKMDLYVHNSKTKLLEMIMHEGFNEGDCCFLNWEKLTNKKNTALKDSEKINFLDRISEAFNKGLEFKIIIDESHEYFTEKTQSLVELFKTNKIIKCSATPKIDKTAKLIEIKETDVIRAGLIKKLLCINEDFPKEIQTEDESEYLINAALEKYKSLRAEYLKLHKDINPLIIIQLPDKSETLLENVEKNLEKHQITLENGLLGIWLSGYHENLEDITNNNSQQIVIIIKQAIATGWDCPRASILVKLREGMDETFEIQTIGRIRRMPEAKHYENQLLDSCYLYTFDPKFTSGVQESLGKAALNSSTLFLKNEYKDIKLTKEQRTQVIETQDDVKALEAITDYLCKTFDLDKNYDENVKKLELNNFIFNDKIVRNTYSGTAYTLDEITPNNLSHIKIKETVNTHKHGREFHNRVGLLGLEIGLEYSSSVTILGKLFANENKFPYKRKLLKLTIKQWYSFVINNFDTLKDIFVKAMAFADGQTALDLEAISQKDFFFPRSLKFTFDGSNKLQSEYNKNVYTGYLSSAEPRSMPEKLFEKFCEESSIVDWWYKNGDKGDDFFSIVYLDNSNRQKLFYPDYIVSIRKELWIIETKGGFDALGNSEDIDIFSHKKCQILTNYVKKNSLKGGFVRFDKSSAELYICIGEYNDDLSSNSWNLLKNI